MPAAVHAAVHLDRAGLDLLHHVRALGAAGGRGSGRARSRVLAIGFRSHRRPPFLAPSGKYQGRGPVSASGAVVPHIGHAPEVVREHDLRLSLVFRVS